VDKGRDDVARRAFQGPGAVTEQERAAPAVTAPSEQILVWLIAVVIPRWVESSKYCRLASPGAAEARPQPRQCA
jgi:hypothetical protein